jgi:hypothetical protein
MIYEMHGVIQSHSHQLLTHRWMLDAERFDRFISQRSPFVTLGRALEGRGDALTIDDATQAAYNAATLARNRGHEVTLFVNSKNVRESTPYYLHVLSSILDKAAPVELELLCRKHLPSEVPAEKTKVREFLKHHFSRLPNESTRQSLLRLVAADLSMAELPIADHLQTLSCEQIAQLIDRGVQLENHGASHADLSIFRDDDVRNEITECKNWLQTHFSIESRYFAVPFGNVLPRFDVGDEIASCWLTANRALHSGFVGPKVYNRAELRI